LQARAKANLTKAERRNWPQLQNKCQAT